MGFLSRNCSGKGPHLALRGESCGFSRVAEGSLGFLSSCDGALRDPFMLPQRSQVSFRVANSMPSFLLVHCLQTGPCAEFSRWTQCSSLASQGSQDSYQASPRESGLVWGRGMELCFPLELSKGYQASCRVQAGNLGFLKRISMGVRPPIML